MVELGEETFINAYIVRGGFRAVSASRERLRQVLVWDSYCSQKGKG
jgi:hypothetical protein